MIGVFVTFQYGDDFDSTRVANIAQNARSRFEGMPGLTAKYFTVDENEQRAVNFYVWDDDDAARNFFSDEMMDRVTGLYGVKPVVDFVTIAEVVDNSAS